MAQFAMRQGFRLYGIALLIVAGWTGSWATGLVGGSSGAIGTAWLALAGLGALVLAGLVATREETFTGDVESIRSFETGRMSGRPLDLYLAGLVGWAAVSVAWLATGAAIAPAVIATGWFVVAAVGAVLTLGLCVSHTEELAAMVSPAARSRRS